MNKSTIDTIAAEYEKIPHPAPPPFSISEFKQRLAHVREGMRARRVDVLLLTTPHNIYYLTAYRPFGYYFFQALLVSATREPLFVVRHYEMPHVKGISWTRDCLSFADHESPVDAMMRAVAVIGAESARIGYEEKGLFLPPEVLDGMRGSLTKAQFVPASGILEQCRRVKSPQEIDYARKAAEIVGIGMGHGVAMVRPGVNENQISGAIYDAMQQAGGEHTSGPYVVAGRRSALPHQTAERGVLEKGQIVFFECGGCYRRYGASLLRIASVGKPTAEVQRISDVTVRALEAVIAAIKPGVKAGVVDRAGRSIVEAAGLGQYWLHRTAYSIGIGFPPGWGEGQVMDIKPDDARTLEPGMVFHVVPLLLIPTIGAIGCSETVLVTDGGAEVLTKFERGLIVC